MSKKCCESRLSKKNIMQGGYKRKILVAMIISALIVGIVVSAQAYSEKKSYGTSRALQSSNGIVKIPLVQVNDGVAHFFHYTLRGKDIRFFILKSSDGVIRTAFDTCDVCYKAKRGYRQEGDFMICNNCGNRFPSGNINVLRGGCNPVPLERTVSGGNLIIKIQDILKGEFYFS